MLVSETKLKYVATIRNTYQQLYIDCNYWYIINKATFKTIAKCEKVVAQSLNLTIIYQTTLVK